MLGTKAGLVERYIGTSYDTVQVVAKNIDIIKKVSTILDSTEIKVIDEYVGTDYGLKNGSRVSVSAQELYMLGVKDKASVGYKDKSGVISGVTPDSGDFKLYTNGDANCTINIEIEDVLIDTPSAVHGNISKKLQDWAVPVKFTKIYAITGIAKAIESPNTIFNMLIGETIEVYCTSLHSGTYSVSCVLSITGSTKI